MVAESCTGGGILQALTAVPGSSAVVWGGVVAYANEAKTGVLGVPPVLIDREGAVSLGVAKSMAWGVKNLSGSDWTVAVTGIAGPDGATPDKPVGTVCIAWNGPGRLTDAEIFLFRGNRDAIRKQAVEEALKGIVSRLDS